MGVTYSAKIGIGFKLSEEELMEFIDIETIKEDTTRREPQYCSRTGKRLEDKIVPVPGVKIYTFKPDGRNCNEHDLWGHELAEAIAKHLGCTFCVDNREYSSQTYIFGPKLKPIEEDIDCGRVDFGGSYSYDDVVLADVLLRDLKKKFEVEGINVGEPGVYLAAWIG